MGLQWHALLLFSTIAALQAATERDLASRSLEFGAGQGNIATPSAALRPNESNVTTSVIQGRAWMLLMGDGGPWPPGGPEGLGGPGSAGVASGAILPGPSTGSGLLDHQPTTASSFGRAGESSVSLNGSGGTGFQIKLSSNSRLPESASKTNSSTGTASGMNSSSFQSIAFAKTDSPVRNMTASGPLLSPGSTGNKLFNSDTSLSHQNGGMLGRILSSAIKAGSNISLANQNISSDGNRERLNDLAKGSTVTQRVDPVNLHLETVPPAPVTDRGGAIIASNGKLSLSGSYGNRESRTKGQSIIISSGKGVGDQNQLVIGKPSGPGSKHKKVRLGPGKAVTNLQGGARQESVISLENGAQQSGTLYQHSISALLQGLQGDSKKTNISNFGTGSYASKLPPSHNVFSNNSAGNVVELSIPNRRNSSMIGDDTFAVPPVQGMGTMQVNTYISVISSTANQARGSSQGNLKVMEVPKLTRNMNQTHAREVQQSPKTGPLNQFAPAIQNVDMVQSSIVSAMIQEERSGNGVLPNPHTQTIVQPN